MIKSVFTQLWNRRRANFSVFLELLFVFCLLWYITDYLFVYAYNLSLPNHRDLKHTWQINLGLLPSDDPAVAKPSGVEKTSDPTPQALYDDYHRILRIIRDYPGVEAVSVSTNQSIPATGSYRGRNLYSLDDTTRRIQVQQMEIYTSTDYFSVFRHTRKDGAEAVRMSDFEWTGSRQVVISRSAADKLLPDGSPTGRKLVNNLNDTSDPMTVIGVIDDTKRFDYLRPRHAVYIPITDMDKWDMNFWANYPAISIRSAASLPDAIFADAFGNDMAKLLRTGNFFFKSIVSFRKISEDTASNLGMDSDLNIRISLMLFFLLNILLCVLGTFWYMVNLRRSETGLRKAMGASSSSISRMLFAEGLCLLTAAATVAMLLEANCMYAGLIDTFGKGWGSENDTVYPVDRLALRFLITNFITLIILSVIILTAIWLPARRASALHPAEALRDE
ncbi:MAG: ABC transporter permease [Tannerella sp.]|jgi:hypothetical protein|nr:ABC transporter permease [Tannerella sp.]